MKKSKRKAAIMLSALFILLAGCGKADRESLPAEDTLSDTSIPSAEDSQDSGEGETSVLENGVHEITYTTPTGETGYVYIPQSVSDQDGAKAPMVLMMMCTGGEARQNAVECGWVDKASEEGIIVMAPVYNNYATYSELSGIISSVEYVAENYPVDTSRIYAAGFSNGGAVAVALASEYPQMFAAVSSYGWMVDMRKRDSGYDMPFQVIQGTEESTYALDSGAMAVMEDEQHAIRSLFLFNEMIGEDTQPDYDETPYWGYQPDDVYTIEPDGREWQVNDYYKDGYTMPFAQLVMIDGADHQPNTSEADVSWTFFRSFSRSGTGEVMEADGSGL